MARDPICGAECDPNSAETVKYRGEDFYFCDPECREQFERTPDRYLRHAWRLRGEGYGPSGEAAVRM